MSCLQVLESLPDFQLGKFVRGSWEADIRHMSLASAGGLQKDDMPQGLSENMTPLNPFGCMAVRAM